MITAAQLRAARALLGIDQKAPGRGGRPVRPHHPAHGGERRRDPRQRRFPDQADPRRSMRLGIELIGEGAASAGGGRGIRLKGRPDRAMPTALVLSGIAALLAVSVLAVFLGRRAAATPVVYGLSAADLAPFLLVARGRRACSAAPVPTMRSPCRSASRGSAPISGSTRCRPSSSPWSTSAASARASMPSATAGTSTSRSACCPSTRPSSPGCAWC